MITFLSPGLRFFHQGQFEGRKKRISPHLVRGPHESIDSDLQEFYTELIEVIRNPIFRDGSWRLLQCMPAWDVNASSESFLAFSWEGNGGLALITVNYAPHASQCYIRLPFSELADESVRFRDLMSDAIYDRQGNEVLSGGIYLDMPACTYHIFEVTIPAKATAEEISIVAGSKKSSEKALQRRPEGIKAIIQGSAE